MSESMTQDQTSDSQAAAVEADPELVEKIGEFARRVVNGERTAEVFGIGDEFLGDVLNQAYQFYRAQSFEKAEVLLRGAIALDVTMPYPYLLLGDILLQNSKYADAMALFEEAQKLSPEDGEVLAKLGESKLRAGQIDEARACLVAAMNELDEESLHYKRAAVLLDVARTGSKSPEAAEET